ncbi:MAG: hypothetical protein IKH84_03525, partial [Ottowia sp.]|nr:hypothetical protein [Ottowia sp.]
RETLKVNGWDFCKVDIMDEDGTIDLPVKNGKWFDHMTQTLTPVFFTSFSQKELHHVHHPTGSAAAHH